MSAHRSNMSADELHALRELAVSEGQRIAAKFFAKRGVRVEVHIDQATLAALLAVAFEGGYETRDAQAKGRP